MPANITLVTLPPYSPELNPMENVWKVLKEHLANRVGTPCRAFNALSIGLGIPSPAISP